VRWTSFLELPHKMRKKL